MKRPSVRRMLRKITLTATVGALSAQLILGQNPQTPAQRDATRPPGTQQNQPIPPQARPITPDPTAPPGTQRVSPTAPPGTNTAPAPGQTVPPTSAPTTTVQPGSQQTQPGVPSPSPSDDMTQTPPEPNLPDLQARPVPPLPDMTRLGVSSGNQLSLTLNDAIRRALENNNDIEVARDDVRFAETQLRSLQGIYDPVFSITPQISKIIQSQQSSLSGATSAGTVSQTDFQVNPSVDKFFETGGGTYSFFFNNNRRSTDSTFNTLNPVYSSSLGVTFTQPLLRDRSIDNKRRQIRIQKKTLEQTDADFRRRTIDVISQVQNAYWDLVFAIRDQENRIANLNLTRENLRRVEAQIAAGAAAPLARAEVQTELANRESDLLLASQQISVAENVLKQLILKDPNAPEWSAVLTPTDSPSFDATPLNLDAAIAEARQNRPELQRLRLQQDINGIDLQFFKNQTKPRIDLVGTLASTGLSGGPVSTFSPGGALIGSDPLSDIGFLFNSLNQTRLALGLSTLTSPIVPPATFTRAPSNLVGSYGRNLRNLFNFDTRNIVVGVTIQIPFKNRTAEANLAGARIQKNQLDASTRLTELQVESEVRNAAQAVETSRRRVLAARAARENAELQLQGEQRLYQVGRSTTFLLFQRENTLANARNAEIRAQTDYNKSLADLQRATSTTLRSNNIIVDSKNP
jgi:outer membrane protein